MSLRQEDCGLKLDVIWKYVLLILSFRILDTSIKKNERFQVCRQGGVLLLLFLLKCAILIQTGQKGKRVPDSETQFMFVFHLLVLVLVMRFKIYICFLTFNEF